MFRSIRTRIIVYFVALILLVMGGMALFFSSYLRNVYIEDLRSSLEIQALLMAADIEGVFDDIDQTDWAHYQEDWANLTQARITVIDKNGLVLADSEADVETMENHLDRPEVQQAMSSGPGYAIRYSETLSKEMIYVAALITGEDSSVLGFARLALPLDGVNEQIGVLNRNIILATGFSVIIAIVLSWGLAQRTIKPLSNLAEVARKITDGDRAVQFNANANDEIGRLGRAIDTMAKQLRGHIVDLEEEQAKLEVMLSHLRDGVVILNEAGNVYTANPAAQNFFEINVEQSIGRSLAQVVRNHEVIDLWRLYRETGEEQSALIELPRQGQIVQTIITPFEEGLPNFSFLLFQDFTELRRLENIRRDFVSNISHELRTPLASLKALSETLQGGAINDPVAGPRFLAQIEVEVEALAHLVSELLELSKIESGQTPLYFENVAPCQLVSGAVQRLEMQAARAEVSLEVVCDESLPTVLVDPPRIEQVFVNLIHNAIKFTDPGGSIIVDVKRVEEFVSFCIRDTGIGIPQKDLSRIFERFYKSDRARSGGGTGLGLAIAKHLAESHHGKLWVESEEGRGSAFYVELMAASVNID